MKLPALNGDIPTHVKGVGHPTTSFGWWGSAVDRDGAMGTLGELAQVLLVQGSQDLSPQLPFELGVVRSARALETQAELLLGYGGALLHCSAGKNTSNKHVYDTLYSLKVNNRELENHAILNVFFSLLNSFRNFWFLKI